MTEVEAIEQELNETRADLEDHVDELAERLTLGRILDEFVLGDRMNLSEVASNETLTKLVIPGALVGAGVTMFLAGGGMSKVSELLSGDGSSTESKDEPDHTADRNAYRLARSFQVLDRNLVRLPEESDAAFAGRRANEYALVLEMEREDEESDDDFSDRIHQAKDMALAAGHEASERLKAVADAARQAAEKAGRKAGEAADAAKSKFEDNPATGLAISLAVGALLGSIIPMGRKEEEVLSGPVDKAAEKVAASARSTAEAAQKFAEKLHETTQEIHQQTAH